MLIVSILEIECKQNPEANALLEFKLYERLEDRGDYSLNLSLKNNRVDANMRVIRLAAITGISRTRIPYASHIATPRQKNENMPNDKSFAERLFHVLSTCGRKAIVVKAPAESPSNCVVFIIIFF
jgi:hypothetical protein